MPVYSHRLTLPHNHQSQMSSHSSGFPYLATLLSLYSIRPPPFGTLPLCVLQQKQPMDSPRCCLCTNQSWSTHKCLHECRSLPPSPAPLPFLSFFKKGLESWMTLIGCLFAFLMQHIIYPVNVTEESFVFQIWDK